MSNQMFSEETTTAISRFIDKYTFFGVLLFDLMQIQETNQVPTAGTDGRFVYINPDFFKALTVDERCFVLAHEVMHVVLEHPWRSNNYEQRGVGPDLKAYNNMKMNIAEDYIINDMLIQSGLMAMPHGGYHNPQYGMNEVADEVYCKLPDTPPKPKGGGGKGSGNTSMQGNTGGFDHHMKPAADDDGNATGPSKADIQRALKSAEVTAKSIGNMPGHMQRLINEICDPQVNWAEELRLDITNTAGRDSTTWARPNRKRLAVPPNIYMPGTCGHQAGTIVVYGDTSGSVSDTEWRHYLGELAAIVEDLNPEQCYVGSCDTEATEPELIEDADDVRNYKPVGGGGTHMPAIFAKLDECDIVPDTLVILTDGYTDFGKEQNYPVIWVITTPSITAPHGKTIHIKVGAAA